MTPEPQEKARLKIEENPNIFTVVDRNGNTESIKVEHLDNININDIINQPQTSTRKSSRLKSTNPINHI